MRKLKKVLIVDDSKLARLTLSRLLKERNLEVMEATSVAEALEILSTADNGKKIDAIFMDVMMPEKDGFEGLEIIKKDGRFKNIPCSMYSGELSVDAQRKAMNSGAQAYLFKPATGEGIDIVIKTLESNAIAKTMDNLSDGKVQNKDDIHSIKLGLATLENRTKSLARVITRERKEQESSYELFDKRIIELSERIAQTKQLKQLIEREMIERKRVESELSIKINELEVKNKTMTIVSSGAAALALLAIAFVFIF